jgi:hypothetical protein
VDLRRMKLRETGENFIMRSSISPNIIKACGAQGKINAYEILVGKRERKKPIGRPRLR